MTVPFGLKHTNYNVDRYSFQKIDSGLVLKAAPSGPSIVFNYDYKYNGKEFQDELGLNMTAMDFRLYDNAVGRFNTMDALSELEPDKSPYAFARNNPVVFNDPTGFCPECDDFYEGQTIAEGQSFMTSFGMEYIYSNGQWTGQGGDIPEVAVPSAVGDYEVAEDDNYFDMEFMNDRLGDGADILGATRNQGGSFRLTDGSYNGNSFSPRFYSSNWIGGSAAGIKTYNVSSVLGKISVAGTVVIGSIQVGKGISQDYQNYQNVGYTNGQNTAVASGGVAGGVAGGWAGAEIGATVGGVVGAFFFGAGAVPGAVVGGIIGGYFGGELGSSVGENAVQSIYK